MSLLRKFQKDQPQPIAQQSPLSAYAQPQAAEPAAYTNAESRNDPLNELASAISERILSNLPSGVFLQRGEETEKLINNELSSLQTGPGLESPDGKALFRTIEDEVAGYGPLEPFLNDDSVTEIMVNGSAPANIFVEKKGRLVETEARFKDDEHVMRVINRIIAPLGRRLSEKWPLVDARLPDGSRVNIIAPPCSVNGPSITVRKFARTPYQINDLVRFGTLPKEVADFIQACVVARLNIVISGGTGTGKTTFLNVLSSFIPDTERIVTIEDAAEIQLHQKHVVTLEARPADPDGTGRVAVRDLVINALRMRPDRIIVGECRGGEALDMLQAMNTGHEGSLTTIHANTPRDCLSRLETMALMSGMDLPLKTVRYQLASALNLIVQMSRSRDGGRVISQVSEVQGMEGEVIVMQDIFTLVQDGVNPDGTARQRIKAAGTRPKFMPKIESTGIYLPANIFGY